MVQCVLGSGEFLGEGDFHTRVVDPTVAQGVPFNPQRGSESGLRTVLKEAVQSEDHILCRHGSTVRETQPLSQFDPHRS